MLVQPTYLRTCGSISHPPESTIPISRALEIVGINGIYLVEGGEVICVCRQGRDMRFCTVLGHF